MGRFLVGDRRRYQRRLVAVIAASRLRHGALAMLLAACACNTASEFKSERAFDEADAALRKGQLQLALDLVGGALDQQRAPYSESPPTWRLRLLRAEILIALADIPEALPLLAAPLPSDVLFDQLRVRQKYLTAKAQVAKGSLKDALATLAAARSGAPPNRDLAWDIAILEGQIGLRLGRWAEAESSLNAVAAEADGAGDRYRQSLAFNNLGMGRLVRGRFDEALTWFERILAISSLESLSVYGVALNNAGICYSRLGQFDRAIVMQQRAAGFHKNGSRVAYQQALGELGTTYLLQGDHARGLDHLRRALTIASDANLKSDAAVWARNLAAAFLDLGRWDDAEGFNNQAKQLAPSVLNTLHDAHIAAGRRRFADAERLFNDALKVSSNQPAINWSAHAGLAAVAVATGHPDRGERHFESALATVEKTRSDLLRADYRISFLSRLIDFYRDYVDFLVSRGRVPQALEIVESSRARVLAERHGVSTGQRPDIDDVRRLAATSRVVLLSYWLAPSRSYVWTVTASGISMTVLPPSSEIEQLVDEHQTMLQNALGDPLSAANTRGDRLYDALIRPVASSIPRGASVIVVPDGALHRINFETLPVAEARRHYWIEDVEVQVAPSLALLTSGEAASPAPRTLLLIGDPLAREPDFPALRYARDEMTGISKRFGAGAVATYQGARAAPAAYRESQPNRFTLIHFTAHATANLMSPLDSAVILSGPEHEFKLYARDIAEQRLSADLVTVSACRSAGERSYSGEGLVGFAWAFLRAGARRVVAGLWDVDDRSTAELMELFYAAMDEGMSPPRALREAKLHFLRQQRTYARPYYWGAFQVFTVAL
jgi:CHAT domain-containing protein/tetratricopeptide (TPR) repeat protein